MAKKLTQAEKATKKFMKNVRDFLASKNNGEVPPEWECSLMLLETYYKQFVQINEEIEKLPSLVVDSRYGSVPSPLLACRDKAAMRLEQSMKEMGITFKAAAKLNVVKPKEEESALDVYLKKKIEKR